MRNVEHNAQLNTVRQNVQRSLLCYLPVARPWVAPGWQDRWEFLQREQEFRQGWIERVEILLDERGWTVRPALSSMEFADWHDLALSFLWPHLLREEQQQVAALDEACHECADDPAAVALLRELLQSSRTLLSRMNANGPAEVRA